MCVLTLLLTNCVIASCLQHSIKSIVKSSVSKILGITREEKSKVEQTGWSGSNRSGPDCYLQIAPGASGLLTIVCSLALFLCVC